MDFGRLTFVGFDAATASRWVSPTSVYAVFAGLGETLAGSKGQVKRYFESPGLSPEFRGNPQNRARNPQLVHRFSHRSDPLAPGLQDTSQDPGPIGHDPIDTEVQQTNHLVRVVDGPNMYH